MADVGIAIAVAIAEVRGGIEDQQGAERPVLGEVILDLVLLDRGAGQHDLGRDALVGAGQIRIAEQSPRRQLTNVRRVAMRRPDRLVGDARATR